jgi:VWFA-related protein
MNARVLALVAIAVLATPAASAERQTPQAKPQAVFRSITDLVTIPVFVKGSVGDVAGLTAADFVLTDNGVRQTVESFDSEAMPVDVTVLIETSHALEHYADTINEQVRRIASHVRATDRIEVLGIDDYVNVLVPFGPSTRALDVERFTGGGMTSVNDALVAALLREADPDRQHLIVAITDTIDTMSTLDMAAVRTVARQSSATLVVTWITLAEAGPPSAFHPPGWATSSEREAGHVRAPTTLGALPLLLNHVDPPPGRTVPARQQWTPHYAPPRGRSIYAFDVLREAAELTGGAIHPPGVFTDRNATTIFDKIYAEFRRNYVLRYLPADVDRVGWHDVTVTVPRHPGLEVRARRGYLVEPAVPPSPAPAVAAAPGSLAALVAAAERDDLAAVRATIGDAGAAGALTGLIEDFRAAGNLWPTTPRREFVAALALADAAVMSADPNLNLAGVGLLARYAPLVRPPTGPDDFERDWLAAEAALLEAALRPAEALPLVTAALRRVPDAPQLLLARAVIADQFLVLPPSAGGRRFAPEAERQLLGFYDAAITSPSVAEEARVRKGWLLRRLGQEDTARGLLEAPASPADATVAAWLSLIRRQAPRSSPSIDDAAWREYWRGDDEVFARLLVELARQSSGVQIFKGSGGR